MPTQSSAVSRLYTYGQYDTDPPLDYQLKDREGNVIVLDPSDEVFIDIGWQSYDHYIHPERSIVEQGPCTIVDAPTGMVRWTPQQGDLKAPGRYDFTFRIKKASGAVRTVRSIARDFIRVQEGPYAGYEELP